MDGASVVGMSGGEATDEETTRTLSKYSWLPDHTTEECPVSLGCVLYTQAPEL